MAGRNMNLPHVRDSIQEIDSNTWLVGEKLLLSRVPLTEGNHMWPGSDGHGYILTDSVPSPLPPTRPMTPIKDIELVYDLGDTHVVFRVGEAFFKIHEDRYNYTTREHVTLNWLNERQLSFKVPRVLFHACYNERTYIVLTPIPGKSVSQLWGTWDQDTRARYADRMIEIIQELGTLGPKGAALTGVDGKSLGEDFLSNKLTEDLRPDCRTETTRKLSEGLGMDCSDPVFYHCDLSPTNVLIDVDGDGSMNLIDWENAGWVPRMWVLTKPLTSPGFALGGVPMSRTWEWVDAFEARLPKLGYTECEKRFTEWRLPHEGEAGRLRNEQILKRNAEKERAEEQQAREQAGKQAGKQAGEQT